MAEDLVFARKASGLVRGLDMWDAFGAGLMTCQPIATLWLMVGIALSLFPSGNLIIAILLGAVLYLMFILTFLYFSFIDPTSRDVTGKNLFVFAAAWIAGLLWYFYWRWRSSKQGIDVSITFGELPPE